MFLQMISSISISALQMATSNIPIETQCQLNSKHAEHYQSVILSRRYPDLISYCFLTLQPTLLKFLNKLEVIWGI